jgi:hypothetical protein
MNIRSPEIWRKLILNSGTPSLGKLIIQLNPIDRSFVATYIILNGLFTYCLQFNSSFSRSRWPGVEKPHPMTHRKDPTTLPSSHHSMGLHHRLLPPPWPRPYLLYRLLHPHHQLARASPQGRLLLHSWCKINGVRTVNMHIKIHPPYKQPLWPFRSKKRTLLIFYGYCLGSQLYIISIQIGIWTFNLIYQTSS